MKKLLGCMVFGPAICLASVLVTPDVARTQFAPPTGGQARTNYVYDRFGNLQGAYIMIWLNNGDFWWFALPARFLNLPVQWQIDTTARGPVQARAVSLAILRLARRNSGSGKGLIKAPNFSAQRVHVISNEIPAFRVGL